MRQLTGPMSLIAVLGVALLAGCGGGSNPEARPVAGDSQLPARPRASTSPPRMDDAAFWRLIAETRQAAGNETGRQSDLLGQRLKRLPAEQIADFERIRHRLDQQVYSWDIWGAAYVIDDGCSDDCFRDFRGYLISLGRGPYEGALRDPDSLASVAQDAETGNWENADDVAPDAYKSVADEDIPTGDSEPSGDPTGRPWDDKQVDVLVARYPKLAARFR